MIKLRMRFCGVLFVLVFLSDALELMSSGHFCDRVCTQVCSIFTSVLDRSMHAYTYNVYNS